MARNHVKLVMEDTEVGRGEVLLNGQPLSGVTDVEIVVGVNVITKVKLTIYSEIEVLKASSQHDGRNIQKFNVHQSKCVSDSEESLQNEATNRK